MKEQMKVRVIDEDNILERLQDIRPEQTMKKSQSDKTDNDIELLCFSIFYSTYILNFQLGI